MHTLFRIIIATLVLFGLFGFAEQSTMAASTEPVHVNTTHSSAVTPDLATTEHHAPHILPVAGDAVEGLSLFGYPVSNTILSTWIFMGFLFVSVLILYVAIRTDAFPKVRTFGLDIVNRLDTFLTNALADKKSARTFLPLVGGFFIFIFLGNIFGLIYDWIAIIFPSMHAYLRPINSDLNTTVVLAVTTIVVAQFTGIFKKGLFSHFSHYFFNFSGHGIIEKIINVPVGWIHFLGEFSRVLSLSVRLFANIFAGAALISVMVYLGTLIPAGPAGGILVLPFWFFEILVAFLQAFIFMMLSAVYLKESLTIQHH